MAAPQRYIAHLDMDAFYASVELLRYPQLKGLPVVIGGRKRQSADPIDATTSLEQWPRLRTYTGRGVITTATYEARALGVHSAMGLMKAAALAPDAILLPADFDNYRHYSRLFKAAVKDIAPLIEDRGIDEIYIDLSDVPGINESTASDPMAGIRRIAQAIKDNVKQATGLSCSIGITPNKLLSKLCSDLEKPNGLTLLQLQDIPTRIWPLPVKRINGIGPRATQKLHKLNILTIGQLATTPIDQLIQHFGSRYGVWLHQSAQGHDDRPLEIDRKTQSISRETTFERDLHVQHDRTLLGDTFTKLCLQVADDLHRKGFIGRNVSIKLKFDNFKSITRAITLDYPTADAKLIRQVAGQCLKRVSFDRKIRLLGIRMGSLTPHPNPAQADAQYHEQGETLPLF